MNYFIGTDIGTSGTKTIVMSEKGELISQDLQEYDVITPKPLWAEQWPDIWLEATKKSIKNAVEKSDVLPENIKGIAISGLYGGSGIPVDKDRNAVRPCMIWMDRRATEQQKWVEENIGKDKIYKITHNGTDPYYGYLKILWMKQNEPENWAKTEQFLPPNAYIIEKLTGVTAVDYSSAGNIGGIFDMNTHSWSYELMDEMGIPRNMMPERLVDSIEKVGEITEESSAEIGVLAGTPVFSGGVDAGTATFGLGVFNENEYAATIGTSMCAALIHSTPMKAKNLIKWPYVYDGKRLSYSFGGGATAGAVIKWFRDTFAELELTEEDSGGERAYAALDRKATEIKPGSNGLVVLPYFMGERSPVWDTDAKGVIFGLSLVHTKAHIYRAFLESVAYSLRHTMEESGTEIEGEIILAGGVNKSPMWQQIFADVTGHPVVCPMEDVEANLGDVMLAGIGTGILTLEDVKSWQVLAPARKPNMENHEIYNRYYRIYRNLYTNLKDDMKEISEIEKN